ncbi:MAG TPA: glycosyltransferase [Pyrinomonadaceae bacterium]|nr:glycosyltransferase [Pyrinomonadaceae bacterium]
MEDPIRVAYFPDSFLEVNGVAMTSNRLVRFVRKRGLPFVNVHAGPKTAVNPDGNFVSLSLKRSPASFEMDEGLHYDPFFHRHAGFVRRELEKFRPDVFHITGLNDVSILGAYLAWKMDVALVGSWHTNLHEYAATRLRSKLSFLPKRTLYALTGFIERRILDGAKLYYRMPQRLLAPNQELIQMLETGTQRKAHLMIRGVDTELFSPAKRTADDGVFRFGFVGRLRAEKNVRLLAELEKRLLAAGKSNFHFLIVGEGSERGFLEENMKTAELPGFLEGEELSRAYANMDVFVFPSDTDAYGNVVQEANASAVPCIVTDQGGPKFIVQEGETGFVARDLDGFVKYSIELIDDREKLERMKKASLDFAMTRSWDSVFQNVYETYREAKDYLADVRRQQKAAKMQADSHA